MRNLGAYNRGDQFPKLIVNNLGAAIQSVLLPAFSARQGEDIAQVRSMVRRAIRPALFWSSPCCSACSRWRTPWWRPFWGKVADLRALSADHVRGLLLLADPHHQSAGHQRSGAQRRVLSLRSSKKTVGILGLVIGVNFSPIVLVSIKARN